MHRRKFFNSIRPGLPSLRLGYLAATLQLGFRTTTGALITLKTSDGSVDNFRDNITKNFPDNSLKESTITIGDTKTVDILSITSPNTLYINGPTGTCDVSAFPNLLVFKVQNSLCTRFIGKIPLNAEIQGAQCSGKQLDISRLDSSDIRANYSYCSDVAWPVDAPNCQTIQMNYAAINRPQVLTNMPNLVNLYLDYSAAPAGAGMGELDISRCLNLRLLSMREGRINAIKSVPGQQLQYLNAIFTCFATEQSGVAGRPGSFAELVTNSRQLYGVDALGLGLSAADQIALFDGLIATEGTRVACNMNGMAFGSINEHYNRFSSIARANEALVTQQAVIKLNYCRSLGHAIPATDYVFEALIISDTELQITLLNAAADITVFGVGSVLVVNQLWNADLASYGEHTVLSGSGKVWVISNTKAAVGFIGFGGPIQVQAIS
jgi:hypothetical protein